MFQCFCQLPLSCILKNENVLRCYLMCFVGGSVCVAGRLQYEMLESTFWHFGKSKSPQLFKLAQFLSAKDENKS